MKATNDSLILEENELCEIITKDNKVHLFNKSFKELETINKGLLLLLDQKPNDRTAKRLYKDFNGILKRHIPNRRNIKDIQDISNRKEG